MKRYTLVLADDDEDDRAVFKLAAQQVDNKIDLKLFEDGKSLMDYLTDNPEKTPDILFLDINMPIKNGFECLREIRATEKLQEICVIIFSTSNVKADVVKAYDFCANGFIQKPSNFHSLKKLIQKVLQTDWDDPCAKLSLHDFVLKP